MPIRIGIYLAGVILVSLGIVLCKQCALGISPVSSLPLLAEALFPITFGIATIIFHMANILIQMILQKKFLDMMLLLQIPLAFLFGNVIDLIQSLMTFPTETPVEKIAALALSVFFTALGMVCMIQMKLIQNPPDGAVKSISEKTGIELGKMKIIYDWTAVGIAALIGFICIRKIVGFGIATVVSALFVGKTVTLITRFYQSKLVKQ